MDRPAESSPFILRFRTKVANPWFGVFDQPGVRFDEDRMVWIGPDGDLLCAGRMKKFPTVCLTQAKTLPSGYTPSGKWKPATPRPAKMDKRAGK